MAPNNPTTIVFIPGAWHSPLVYSTVAHQLSQAGYGISLVALPSVDPPKHHSDWSADVAKIREHIEEGADKGHEVIVCVHSYGGLPGNEAVKGLALADRQKDGKKGGVSHIFFCCSFVIPEGNSLIAAFGGNDLPWFAISDDRIEVNPATPAETFYNDMPKDQVDAAVAHLKPHSYQTFHSPVTYAAWKSVPSTYLFCERDAAIPIQVQKLMVEEWAKGSGMKTETIDASHSPFFSQPEAVIAAIRRAAGEKV